MPNPVTPTPPSETPPATTPSTPPPATPPATPPAAPAAATTENLLDGAPATPPATPPAATAELTEEAIGSFIGAIPAIDIGTDAAGKPIPFDPAAMKAIAPALIKSGVKPEQAKEIIGAYAEHMKAQATETAKQENAFIGELVAKAKAELGADLPTFIADAKKGGAKLFGEEFWGQLRAIPVLSNNVQFIKAMAAYGRSIKTDDGAGTGSGGPNNQEKPLAERWGNPK